MNSKTAQKKVSVLDLVKHRMVTLGIPSAAKGLAVAAGVKMYSDYNASKEERDRKKNLEHERSARTVARTPEPERKNAELDDLGVPSPGGWFSEWPRGHAALDLPVTVAAAILPGLAAFRIVNKRFESAEQKSLERDIAKLKSRHLDAVSGTVGKDSKDEDRLSEAAKEVSDAVKDVPNIVAGAFGGEKDGKKGGKERKAAEERTGRSVLSRGADTASRAFDAAMGGLVLASVTAGIMTHRRRLEIERDLDRMYERESRKSFKERNPDLLVGGVALEPAARKGASRKDASTVLQNTLIALNLHNLGSSVSSKRVESVSGRARIGTEDLEEEVSSDIQDISPKAPAPDKKEED